MEVVNMGIRDFLAQKRTERKEYNKDYERGKYVAQEEKRERDKRDRRERAIQSAEADVRAGGRERRVVKEAGRRGFGVLQSAQRGYRRTPHIKRSSRRRRVVREAEPRDPQIMSNFGSNIWDHNEQNKLGGLLYPQQKKKQKKSIWFP